jgi:hypothetical protein
VAEIKGSRELGGSQGESPGVGRSKSKSRNCEERGQPLDPGHRRTVGSGTPSPIARSGVRRLKGVVFDFTSSKVLRAGHKRTRGKTTRWARVTDR